MDNTRFCRPQVFVFLFLLLELPKAKGDCTLISQEHCVCSLLNRSEIQNFIQCITTTTYELRGGNLQEFVPFSDTRPNPDMIGILEALLVNKLIFTDLIVPEVLLPPAMEFVSHVPTMKELAFVNCTFLRADRQLTARRTDLRVSSLRFHRVTAVPLADRLDLSSLNRWLGSLENLTVTESQVTSIPCKIGQMFRELHVLDVSGNHFQDQSIKSSFCQGAFPQLQVLKLQHNNLTSYNTVCEALGHLSMLAHLDLSQNDLPQRFPSCVWPQSLHILNVSNTGLEHMDSALPPNIKILDLSANKVTTLDLSLSSLKELYLSNNRLKAFSSFNKLQGLDVLSLDHNQISQLPNGLERLQTLKAGHNFYTCTCHQTKIIQDLATKESLMPDWPQDYTCKSPPEYQNVLLKDVPVALLQCNKALAWHGTMVVLLTSCFHLVFCLFFV